MAKVLKEMTKKFKKGETWDDPERDFRQRYYLPEQFLWDKDDWARIMFDSYTELALGLLPKPPARVLDAGCGPGLCAKILREHGYEVVGIDYNERGIAFAKLLVPEAEFLYTDIRQLSKMTTFHNQFDAATHIEVLEHIPAELHVKVLQGLLRSLRPNGTLVLTVPSIRMPLNKWHYKHFKLDEIINLIKANGFKVTNTIYQYRLSPLFSRQVRRILINKYYDIRFARRILRRIYFARYNTTHDPEKAGRFIVQAMKIDS